MNTFEINKIVGAGLTALLSLIVISHIGNTLVTSGEVEHEPAAGHGEATTAETAAPKEAEPIAPLAVRLAQGDAAAGQKVFKKCGACHTTEDGGANKVGPNLWGMVGRAPATVPGFAYSDAMKALGGEWTLESLDAFLADPKGMVPGTKMSFAGIRKPDQRADVILYLRGQSASPVPLPTPEAAATTEALKEEIAEEAPAKAESEPAPAKAEEAQTAAAPATGDPAAGEKVFRKCKACHTVDQGGPNRVGPNLYGIVGRARAAVADFSYSPAMASNGEAWTEASLDAYLADPKGAVPGTKMAFAGLKKEADRADVIAYLKSISN